jgi:hypothetical protein
MALPNVIWPWSIFYSKNQLLRNENKESLKFLFVLKLNINWEPYAELAMVLQYMECLKSKILKTESWKLKIDICMWNVWKLKFWELKCLNWDVWILKAEKWNLKFLCEAFGIWNLKIEMSKFGCVNTGGRKLKTEM